jgi:hypothetical protein
MLTPSKQCESLSKERRETVDFGREYHISRETEAGRNKNGKKGFRSCVENVI